MGVLAVQRYEEDVFYMMKIFICAQFGNQIIFQRAAATIDMIFWEHSNMQQQGGQEINRSNEITQIIQILTKWKRKYFGFNPQVWINKSFNHKKVYQKLYLYPISFNWESVRVR